VILKFAVLATWSSEHVCLVAQEQRRTALEEKLRVMQATRDELQTYSTQQSGLVSELQSRNSQLTIDNESLRRRIADLQQVTPVFSVHYKLAVSLILGSHTYSVRAFCFGCCVRSRKLRETHANCITFIRNQVITLCS